MESGRSPTGLESAAPRRRRQPYGVLIGLAVLGALGGVLWAFLVPTAQVRVTADGSVSLPPAQLARLFDGVAIFALLAFGLGLICGAVIWFAHRQVRGWFGLLTAVVMALLSSSIAMDVGLRVARARYSADDPSAPGVRHLLPDLWLEGAGWNSMPAPWLLLTCAPGLAALTYLILAVSAADTAWLRDDEPMSGPPPEETAAVPADWTYPGAAPGPAMPPPMTPMPPPSDPAERAVWGPPTPAGSHPVTEPVTEADEEWRTRR
ncbi:DUF2567 domain-containing protein [Gordonia hirsuta]|uniref:DUF2567 domain-containing protein n=1 Tax=Gordonia hirsuta TaxID=53427 RepID=UPI00138AB88F|nr:DUF2567 domain-containing protein [Gordonia hirsuta]